MKVEAGLQKSNEQLIQNIMRNFGETAQDLPGFRLPDIRRTHSEDDIDLSLGFTDFRDIKMSATKLKVAPSLRKNYAGKRTLLNKNKRTMKQHHLKRNVEENYLPDPPPISDEDINRGMINLKIPKDVDITPAFERGCPPLLLKPATIHYGHPKDYIRREIATGPTYHKFIKYDLQPEEDRVVSSMPSSSRVLVPYSGGSIGSRGIVTKSQLEIEAYHDEDNERFNEHESDNIQRSKEKQRGYNELLDEFSLHQFIIRKGK